MTPASPSSLRIAILIATKGRASVLGKVAKTMLSQTRPADHFVVVGVEPSDVAGLDAFGSKITILLHDKPGLCRQRNRAMDHVAGAADVAVFFDDDYVPSPQFIERLEAFFIRNPDVVGVTGRVYADGVTSGGISFERAVELVRQNDPGIAPIDAKPEDMEGLYGCNMAMRLQPALEVRFDERLPLYGWQEDSDFSSRLARYGRIVRSPALGGVHMGVTSGRLPGVRTGYSQVANVHYLVRKGTMRPGRALNLAGRNFVANLVKSLWPEPWVDRFGRLRGNLLALADIARGRCDPERILSL